MKRTGRKGAISAIFLVLVLAFGANTALAQDFNFGFMADVNLVLTSESSSGVDSAPFQLTVEASPTGVTFTLVDYLETGLYDPNLLSVNLGPPSAWSASISPDGTSGTLELSGSEEGPVDFIYPATQNFSYFGQVSFVFEEGNCPTSLSGQFVFHFDAPAAGLIGVTVTVALTGSTAGFNECVFEISREETLGARFEVYPFKFNLCRRVSISGIILPSAEVDPANIDPSTIRLGPAGIKPLSWKTRIAKRVVVVVLVLDVRGIGLESNDTNLCFSAQTWAGETVEGCDVISVRPCRR